MPANNNADDYAAPRQNVWFTAHNETPADGNLTGQCVTLEKWFLQDMASVPAPFSARGHGKDVGRTLVNQGHAVEVPFAERRRGDIICYEFGTYGHVAIQLSGGRVFESNVNWSGVATKIVDGGRVYASRIGSENEAWRVGKNPHIYRLKSYKEGGDMPATRQDVTDIYQVVIGRDPVESEYAWVNQPHMTIVNALRGDANQQRATADQTIKDLQKQVQQGSGEFVETKVYIKKEK